MLRGEVVSAQKPLSATQIKALRDFAQAGGHGYGEYAYLSRPTAKSLERRGLVRLFPRWAGPRSGKVLSWGEATEEGKAFLAKLDAEREAELDELLGRTP